MKEMGYKTLYRTYRPREFTHVVGQDHIVRTLQNIIQQGKISHAYLFAGPKGTGKTSVAHIFARAVNATNANKTTDLDIIEIDAASNNGVMEVRNLIDNARYAPANSTYKVYIIDEVHMMTKGAFNALLKTLEEPPQYVIFILATTEVQKIPLTILSRCQRFNFHRLGLVVIKEELRRILQLEKITFDEDALVMLAFLANGAMRDALSLADQASAFNQGHITVNVLRELFGVISGEAQIHLLNYSYLLNHKASLAVLGRLFDEGADGERLINGLLNLLRDYLVWQKTGEVNFLENYTELEIKALQIDPDFAYQAINILMEALMQLKYADNVKQVCEIVTFKLLTIRESLVESKRSHQENTDVPIPPGFRPSQVAIKASQVPNKSTTVSDEQIRQIIAETGEFNVNDLQTSDPTIMENTQVKNLVKTNNFNSEEEQVIKLFELKKKETPNKVKLFDLSDQNFLLNLLCNAEPELLTNYKLKWDKILLMGKHEQYADLALLLNETKIIAAGSTFILVGSENYEAVTVLGQSSHESILHQLTNELFGKPLHIFAITRDQFKVIKEVWSSLSATKSLPQPEPIPLPVLAKSKDEAKELGTSIFGNIFETN